MKEPSGIESADAVDTENLVASEAAEKSPRRLRVGLRLSLVLFAIFTMGLTAAAVHVPLNIASKIGRASCRERV